MEKPSDFLLGLLDFFAVLLPGMVTVALSYPHVYPHLPSHVQSALTLTPGAGESAKTLPWIVLLFASYALGHFVFGIGANLDPVYDQWRRRRKQDDSPFKAATAVREALTPEMVDGEFSTVKWARTYVGIHSAAARLEIDRYEATSKFFRSMVVVAAGAFAHFVVVTPHAGLAAVAAIAALFSFERFCDQRWKMTETTYAAAVLIYRTTADKKAPAG